MTTSIPTTEEVELLTGPALVSRYNELAALVGQKTVRKFETTAVGRSRLEKVCVVLRHKVKQAGETRQAPKAEASKAEAPKAPKAEASKATKATKAPTVSARAEALILDGLTNQAVWDIICVEFNLDDKKKSYPGWYRARLVRNGLLKKGA